MRRRFGDRAFDIVNTLVMGIAAFVTLYPFIYIWAISFNDGEDSRRGGIFFWPRVWSSASYTFIFADPNLLHAFVLSVLRTVIGTLSSLLCTSMLAYAFTKRRMPGYRLFYLVFVVSMFVSGGLIPMFMLYRWIHIYDTFLVYVLPTLIGVYNMILMRTFFMQLPAGLQESAVMDGANDFQIFYRIVLPLAKPVLATIGLFIAVMQWNTWYDTLFFTTGREALKTLQYSLMEIIRQAGALQIAQNPRLRKLLRYHMNIVTPESVKMAITIIATVPILVVYPFLQKYFVKGIMIGALKG